MRTTLDVAAVERQAVTGPITALLLKSRECLPHGVNGRGPAPSSALAAGQRKMIALGRTDPIGTLYSIITTDIVDRVPLSEAKAALHALEAAIDAFAAAEQVRRDRPLPTLVRSQTKAEYMEHQAEHDVLEHPDSPAALEKLRRTTAQEIETLTTIHDECEHELAVIRCGSRVAYGTRRGSLQAVR